MDETRTKEVLDFLLSSYRAKMAIQNPTENCPFDFQQFYSTWKDHCEDWSSLKLQMKRNLEPLIHEGIFDSIIPYLSSSINQSVAKRDELTKQKAIPGDVNSPELNSTGNGIISTELLSLTPTPSKSLKNYSQKKVDVAQRGTSGNSDFYNNDDCEIIIHVCDEAKNIRQDFKCIQSILVQEMGYFSKVTVKGQKLRDMDISVHCDISVFDWLMRWIKLGTKKDKSKGENHPKLEPSNVIGLMVSAEFLQMPLLTTECIQYTSNKIDEVILHSPNLGCLNESLTQRLSTYFNNLEMETKIVRIDKSDRISSRLYTQFLLALTDRDSKLDVSRGHFSSTASLFRCHTCGKLLINDVASKVPCLSMRLDCRGRLYSSHFKDPQWTLSSYVKELKRELKSWRKVYWRVWATVHFLSCSVCQIYFPAKDFGSCQFHPKPPQLSINVNSTTGEIQERDLDLDGNEREKSPKDKEECINPFRRHRETFKKDKEHGQDEEANVETINCAFGVHPCCRKSGYKFYPLPSRNGCQFRDHSTQYTEDDPIFKRILSLRDLIVVPPKEKEARKSFDWGGIADLTPPKLPTTSSPFPLGQGQGQRLLFPRALNLRDQSKSSSTDSQSPSSSDPEDGTGAEGRYCSPFNPRSQPMSEFWSWNSDFTTRYNQDMQREKEEKLMADLELLLSQRVSLDTAGSSISSLRFGYLSRRVPKNLGGSYIMLEEKWREEQQKSGKSQRQAAKSAKP